MKFYNTFKRSDGNYSTQEFSGAEMVDFNIFMFMLYVAIGTIAAAIVSFVCLIVRIFDYNNNEKMPNFVGIGVSLCLLIDYHYQWLATSIMSIVFLGNMLLINTIMTFNMALLITHILLLIFGDTVYFNIKKISVRKETLIIYTIFCLLISYQISRLIYPSNKIKYDIEQQVQEKNILKEKEVQHEKEIEERYSNCK